MAHRVDWALLIAGKLEKKGAVAGVTARRMQRGVVVALSALLSNMIVLSAAADDRGGDPQRLYDSQTDCAVFDVAGFAAEKASWDGPCTHGLASGRGTATFFKRGGESETISAEFLDGIVADGSAEIAWSDGAHYTGRARDGRPDGTGVLVDAKGNRFDGVWKDGALNGRGSITWTNGDRYEGDLVAGKAEGHGVQVWADGQKYDGQWRNDQPNGPGTLTRKDGTVLAGTFIDGKRQVAAVLPQAAVPSPVAATAASPSSGVLDGFAGRTLVAVDGSTVAFTAREGSVLRTTTAPDGTMQKSVFQFLGNGLGTVTDAGDPPTVSGVFRTTSDSVQVEFSDGHFETLAPLGDGLAITLKSAAGDQVCAAWYPQGHAFSAEERETAVAAYAHRLGLPAAAAAVAHPSCTQQTAVPASERRSVPVAPRHKPGRGQVSALAAPIAASGLQPVPIKVSTVHLIDGAATRDSIDTAAAGTINGDEPVASNCLKVDSDGSYWGFRNHCGYAVQFAYCLLRGNDEMTSCRGDGTVSVPGSVSASGFGALFADDSLGERDVEHDFRWVGCKGGAGEVAAHLDAIEPASGHCVRAGRTLAQGN